MRHVQRLTPTLRAAALALLLGAMGCGPGGTPEDRALAERITQEHAGRLRLSLEDELYVRATLQRNARISDAELEQVSRDFFLRPDGTRRDSRYVYLNVYDAADRFLFQLFHDPRTGEVSRGRAEHY